jgi:lipoprotein-anchoring transpeptidase ErfK/SrfK
MTRAAYALALALTGCTAAPTGGPADPRPLAPLASAAPVASAAPLASATSTDARPPPTPWEALTAFRCPAGYACDLDAWDATPRPRVDEVLVEKAAHRLSLVSGDRVVRVYGVAIGPGGAGPKRYEGDWVTPTGTYRITGRVPSKWHTFLALDYPNQADRARHADLERRGEIPAGRGPGHGIGIHGHRPDQPDKLHKLVDWTRGCVALDLDEIDEVAAAAPVGTRVRIVD